MTTPSQPKRVLELTEYVIADHASLEQIAELEMLLMGDPELRRVYLNYVMVHGQLALTTDGLPAIDFSSAFTEDAIEPAAAMGKQTSRMHTVGVSVLAGAALIALSFGVYFILVMTQGDSVSSNGDRLSGKQERSIVKASYYDNREMPIHTVGVLESDRLTSISPTTLTVQRGETRFTTANGTDVQIHGPAMFGVSSKSGGVLFNGAVQARLSREDTNYSIQTAGLRVVDRGTDFRVETVEPNRIRVDVLEGKVEVQSRLRTPLYYWTFDHPLKVSGSNERNSELAMTTTNLETWTNSGLVGSGALLFDDNRESVVRIREGTGLEIGTGDLACSSGISIEAMVICKWSGQLMDYDEIFRKEDGNYRMLLSFQNDENRDDFARPKVAHGPCLSFGLHLEQHGYSELDMPLDGRDGRPTLSELTGGQPHHFVANYDSFTGLKSIYIDGRLRFSYKYPVGTLILNGGPTPIEIGNHSNVEPFTGTIDEVAYYDFSLSSEEIAVHHERAIRGLPYFDAARIGSNKIRWRAITHIASGTSQLFDRHSGVPVSDNEQ